MKKVIRFFSVILSPVISLCVLVAGCGIFTSRRVDISNSGIMQDIDSPPEVDSAYGQFSNSAYSAHKALVERVSAQNSDNPDFDVSEDEEIKTSACETAAKLFAYACYNERQLDKYVYFSHQEGRTDLGSSGSAEAVRQEYYLRVNESDDTCGYRYHYTIKKVVKSNGAISNMKGIFESARLRVTDETDLLYRFEGDSNSIAFSEDIHEFLDCNLLECDWATGSDWGKHDVVMKKSPFIHPDNIEQDIIENAGEDNITIKGNIDILAKDIVENAIFMEDGEGCLTVFMTINVQVANQSEASLKMLRKGNGSDDCKWAEDGDGMVILFRLWDNGLFRFYNIKERWSGKISGFSGEVDSETKYYYSYSDRDCDMTANLQMLESAKEKKG